MSAAALKIVRTIAAVLVIVGAIAVVAVVAATTIANGLARAYAIQEQILIAQRSTDALLRLQIDGETGLRGFAITRDATFLQPYRLAVRSFAPTLATLRASLDASGVTGVRGRVDEIETLHAGWSRSYASVVLGSRTAGRDRAVQLRGKRSIDRIRFDAAEIDRVVERRANDAERRASSRFERVGAGALAGVFAVGAIVLYGALRQQRLRDSLARERGVVGTLQRAFVNRWDRLPAVDVGTTYMSATTEAAVGGDLFDIRRIGADRGYVLIADVSGKGVEAAVDTAFIKYAIRALARDHASPARIVTAFDELYRESRSTPDAFVVVFLGIIDLSAATLVYTSAGHSAAWLRRGDDVRALDVTGPILGVFDAPTYREATLALAPADLLVLATDGLTEARRRDGTMLLDDGALAWIARGDAAHPQRLLDDIVTRLHDFVAGPLRDDLAMLALRFDGVAAHAGSHEGA